MPRKITQNALAAQVETEIDQELDELVAAIAAEDGLAKGAVHVSPEREVELWGQRDPQIDYDAFKAQLMAGRVPADLFDPRSDTRLALLRANPERAEEWAALFSEITPERPLDEEMADLVATAAEWPFRTAVLSPYEDDPRGMVRRAESINQRWLSRRGALVPEFGEPPPGGASASASTTLGFDEPTPASRGY